MKSTNIILITLSLICALYLGQTSGQEVLKPNPVNTCNYYRDEQNCFRGANVADLNLGNNARYCCSFKKGFVFKDHCQNRPDSMKKDVCAPFDDEISSKLEVIEFNCPLECTEALTLKNGEFSISNGNLVIDKDGKFKDNVEVREYCGAYQCGDDNNWEKSIKTCLCIKPDKKQSLQNSVDQKLRPCESTKSLNRNGYICPNGQEAEIFETFNLVDSKVEFEKPLSKKLTREIDNPDYCIGPSWEITGDYTEFFQNKLFLCQNAPAGDNTLVIVIVCVVVGIGILGAIIGIVIKKKQENMSL